MTDPRRGEVERLAQLTFKARQQRLIREAADERYNTVARVRARGNAGGYLTELIRWAVERLRKQIAAHTDAYIEAFNVFDMPCDVAAERTITDAASQFTAGSIANVRGDRNVSRHHLGQGVPWHLEIEREMGASVNDAIARMRMQRATIQNTRSEAPVNQTFNVSGPNSRINLNSVDNSVNVARQEVPFGELRKAIEAGVMDGVERASILDRLAELESAGDKETVLSRYAGFIALCANHMQVILPFVPALSGWIHSVTR